MLFIKKKYRSKNITIIDNNNSRLKIAQDMGVKSTLCINLKEKKLADKILKKNKMQKFDFVVSANNNMTSHKLCLDLVSKGGAINLFGGVPKNYDDTIKISANKIHYEQIHFTGSFSSNKKQLQSAYNFIKENKSFFLSLISKPIAISQAIEYFNLVRFNKILKGVVKL